MDPTGSVVDLGYVNLAALHSGDDHGGHRDYAVVFHFMLTGLICGMITFHVFNNSSYRIPYTVAVLLEGLFLGGLHSVGVELGHLGDSIDLWVHIDPHLLLYGFLPILLFGDAMKLNWEIVKGCIAQCLLLAGPGVLFGAFTTGLFVYYILPYSWDYTTCLCFGSILAATDPVAVIGLLGELGCSQVLTMQIAGESLLNDGTAMVLFTIASKTMTGTEYTPLSLTLTACQLAFGAVILGAILGTLAVVAIKSCSNRFNHNDQMLQAAITVVCAYLVFYFCEHEAGCSGVLATVVGAVMVSRVAWPMIVDVHSVHSIWHVVEFFANTLIFFLAGAVIATVFTTRVWSLSFSDWGWLLVLYGWCLVNRAVMVLMFYPLLRRLGFGTNWKDCLVVSWGGLRGAVSLALAMAVDGEVGGAVGTLFVFHIGGVALLTLCVNATTCKKLVMRLGMTQRSEAKESMLTHLRNCMREHVRADYAGLSQQQRYSEHHEALVRSWVTMLREAEDQADPDVAGGAPSAGQQSKELTRRGTFAVTAMTAAMSAAKTMSAKASICVNAHRGQLEQEIQEMLDRGSETSSSLEAHRTCRVFFYSALRYEYKVMVDTGLLPARSSMATVLLCSVAFGESMAHRPLADLASVFEKIGVLKPYSSSQYSKLAARWRGLVEGTLLGNTIIPIQRYGVTLDLCGLVSFIDAHEAAQKEVEQSMDHFDSMEMQGAVKRVIAESRHEVSKLKNFLAVNNLDEDNLNLARTHQMAMSLLNDMTKLVHHWEEIGAVTPLEAEELLHSVHHDYQHLAQNTYKDLLAAGFTDSHEEDMLICLEDSSSSAGVSRSKAEGGDFHGFVLDSGYDGRRTGFSILEKFGATDLQKRETIKQNIETMGETMQISTTGSSGTTNQTTPSPSSIGSPATHVAPVPQQMAQHLSLQEMGGRMVPVGSTPFVLQADTAPAQMQVLPFLLAAEQADTASAPMQVLPSKATAPPPMQLLPSKGRSAGISASTPGKGQKKSTGSSAQANKTRALATE